MADVAAAAEVAVRVLEIPVQNSDEVVAVPLDELPDDAEEVEALVDVLKAEKAELRLWLDFAMEYYRQARCLGRFFRFIPAPEPCGALPLVPVAAQRPRARMRCLRPAGVS